MNDATAPKKRTSRRPDPVKIMEAAFALVLVLILAVVVIGLVPLSHPRLTQKVIALIKQGGADSCSIGKVSVTLWKGVSLHDVSLAGALDADHRYSARARSIRVQSNLLRVGLNLKKITAIVTDSLQDLGKQSRGDRLGTVRYMLRVGARNLHVKGVAVAKATIEVREKGKPLFRGKTIDFDLTPSESGKEVFHGSFSADSIVYSNVNFLNQASGDFSGDGGLLDLSRCKGRVLDGKMKLNGRIDLAKGALSELSLSISNFDLAGFSPMLGDNNGRLGGKADLKLALDSSALAVDSLRGKGTLSASRFDVENFPFQRSLVSMLVYPPLARLQFKTFKIDFSIKSGRIITNEARGDGDSLTVKASGWFRTDGLLNEKCECTFSPASVRGMPPFAQKTLEETPSGGRVIRFKLYGMIGNPKFQIDNKVILQKAVSNMFDDVRNNLQKWLR